MLGACWQCKALLVIAAAAILVATGGAGLPAAGAAVGTALGVSATKATAVIGGIAGMGLGAAMDWICCKLGWRRCCRES